MPGPHAAHTVRGLDNTTWQNDPLSTTHPVVEGILAHGQRLSLQFNLVVRPGPAGGGFWVGWPWLAGGRTQQQHNLLSYADMVTACALRERKQGSRHTGNGATQASCQASWDWHTTGPVLPYSGAPSLATKLRHVRLLRYIKSSYSADIP